MIHGKSNLSGKGYETKGEVGPHKSMGSASPSKIRKHVGDVKNVMAGRTASTQDTAENITPSFDEAARSSAAKY